jgi:hypothetical protein
VASEASRVGRCCVCLWLLPTRPLACARVHPPLAGRDGTTDAARGSIGGGEPVAALLNAAFVTALDNKEVRERLTGFGLQVAECRDNTQVNLKKHIDDFAATYGRLINETGSRRNNILFWPDGICSDARCSFCRTPLRVSHGP